MAEIIKRKGSDGRTHYYARFTDADGKRKMRATKQGNEKDARRFVVELEARIARGKIGIPEPTPEEKARRSITIQQLSDRFLEDYRAPRLKDRAEYVRQARSVLEKRVLPTFGALAAVDLSARDVERLRDRLLEEKYAPGSVVTTMRFVSQLFTWGHKVGLVDCGNPAQGVERPREEASLDFFDHAEVGRLLRVGEQGDPALFALVATAVYTGLRKGELFGLRWRDVHLDAKRLDVMRSYELLPKSGKPRHVPLHVELLRILRAWKERCPSTPDGLVFPVASRWDGWRMGERDDT